MRKYIPRELGRHGVEYGKVFPYGTEKTVEWRPGDTHSRTIKRVCKTCNSGWMSRLQEAAKPILVPMLCDKPIVLNRRMQKTLSAWIAMTCMTGEYLNADIVAISQADRTLMQKEQRVPRHWRIWIARYEPTHRLWRWNHRGLALAEEEIETSAIGKPADSNTQTTTMCVGDHFLFHAMSSEIAATYIARWNFNKAVKPALLQIWPAAAASIAWPPERTLNKVEIDYIAEEFFRRGDRIARKFYLSGKGAWS